MKLSQQELYTILKGLNMISTTNETTLNSLDIFLLQQKIQASFLGMSKITSAEDEQCIAILQSGECDEN